MTSATSVTSGNRTTVTGIVAATKTGQTDSGGGSGKVGRRHSLFVESERESASNVYSRERRGGGEDRSPVLTKNVVVEHNYDNSERYQMESISQTLELSQIFLTAVPADFNFISIEWRSSFRKHY